MPPGATGDPATGRRRVLVLAYLFPPTGGAGVQRIVKFVHFLADHGWDATVVTTRSEHYPARDATLLAELPPGTRIVTTADPGVGRFAARGFDYLRLRRLTGLAAWPDDAVWWAPGALRGALRAVRDEPHHAILSTSPPFSAHAVASRVARRTGLPWIADFRDEWADNPDRLRPLRALAGIEERLERRTLAPARRIITVVDYFRVAGAGAEDPRRVTIMNGVDASDLPRPGAAAADADTFTMTFVGTLYGDRDARPVLDAIRRLGERGAIDPARCAVRIVGSMWLRELGSTAPVPLVQTGYVDHATAVSEMAAATVLLFHAPASTPAPSGKIFEYLATERPILCVARADNLASRLVHEWDAGVTAEPDDGAAIDAALLGLYERWIRGELMPNAGLRERTLATYSRETLAGELARLLDAEAARG